MEQKSIESLSSSLAQAKTGALIDQINSALQSAGIKYYVEKVTLAPVEAAGCRCLRYGVIGYDRTCTPKPGGGETCVERPIYGCQSWDCT